MANQLTVFYQAMPQLADHPQSLDVWNGQKLRELKMAVNSLELQSTQSQLLLLLLPPPPSDMASTQYASARR